MRKLMIPVLVVTIVLLLMSVFVIQEGERGLVIRFGRVLDDNGASKSTSQACILRCRYSIE